MICHGIPGPKKLKDGDSLNIDVTVSLDGSCPGTDAAEVPAGSTVYYCYTVTNLGGDTPPTQDVWDDLIYLSRDRFLDGVGCLVSES